MTSILTTENGRTDGEITTTWKRRPGLTRRQALAAGAVALSFPLAGCLETVRGRTDDTEGATWGPTYFGGEEYAAGFAARATSDGGSLLGGHRQPSGAGEELSASNWLIKLAADGTQEWDRIYDGDAIGDVIETEEEYVFVGRVPSQTDEPAGIQLTGVEKADGAERWTHTYETSRHGHGVSVVRATDGGFLVGGSVSSGLGTRKGLVLKVDSEGQEEWSYTYDGPNDDGIYAAIEADDGGYVFVGSTHSLAGDEDGLLGKVGADGTEEWV